MTRALVTASALRMYRRCAREYRLQYVDGYRPVAEPDALRFGRLVHVGLEAWWRASTPERRMDDVLAALDGAAADPFERVRAEVALRGYDATWGDEPYTALAVEAEFRAPLRNPATGARSRTYDLGGRLDAIVYDERAGRVKLVEHKTTSEDLGPGSAYWARLILDPQVSTYFAGGRALGYDITECIYDVIGKPALRPGTVPLTDEAGQRIVLDADGARVRTRTGAWRQTGDASVGYAVQMRAETPEEFCDRLLLHYADNPRRYYRRGTVVRLESEVADAAHDLWMTAQLVREARHADRWPRNPDACMRYGRPCEFFGVCTGTASLHDPTQFRRVDHVHEELTTDAA